MRYYVTSDTHGFYDELISQLKSAGYFDDTDPHKLIILGDLMDRGNQAKELQDFVIDLIEKDEVVLIRGNHEDLHEELATVDHGLPLGHHISNGTYDTALQLTGYDMAMARIRSYDFADAAKETAFYKIIMLYVRLSNCSYKKALSSCSLRREEISACTAHLHIRCQSSFRWHPHMHFQAVACSE